MSIIFIAISFLRIFFGTQNNYYIDVIGYLVISKQGVALS